MKHNPDVETLNYKRAEEMGEDAEGMINNNDRADYALAAIEAFQEACATDDEDAVADLVCNLGHLCAMWPERFGSFEAGVARGQRNYDEEKPQ